MHKLIKLLSLILLFITAISVFGECYSRKKNDRIIVGNRLLELTFVPSRGGRCTSLKIKATNTELVGNKIHSGLFIDHWGKYVWPSGLMHLNYKYEILKKPNALGIRLWTKIPTHGGGKGSSSATRSAKIPTTKELIGLVVSKTIWLTKKSDMLKIEQEIQNTSKSSKMISVYIQNALALSPGSLNINWYMPSETGISIFMRPKEKRGKSTGKQWIDVPVAGWMAGIDRNKKSGLAFIMDYNYLKKLYSCGSTAEWFYDNVLLPSGESFKTEYFIKPIKDFKNLAYASKDIIADIVPSIENGKLKIALDYTMPRQMDCNITVFSLDDRKELFSQNFTLSASKTLKRKIFHLSLKPEKLIIRVKVKKHEFEIWFNNLDSWEKEHDYKFKSGLFADLAGTVSPYRKTPPPKIKKYNKYKQNIVINKNTNDIKVLVVYGLYTRMLRIWDALDLLKQDGRKISTTWVNCPPNGVENFPASYQELADYNVIILCDVNQKALGQLCLNMIQVCVKGGRGLLLTGGPYALGNGEFADKTFLEMLPVKLTGPFDLKWAGKGKSWKLKKSSSSPILNRLTFDSAPDVYWMHHLTPKKDSQIILKANGLPALVTGSYGKGKVAVLSLSPTGCKQNKEDVPWWDWTSLPELEKNLIIWLKN